jgi:hypothetical protein
MPSTLTLNVEKDELLARADELEAPLPGQPSENPSPPCALALARTVANQVTLSADNMRLYLDVGQRERQRLAQSLRNAAKAYEDVDEDAAQALNTGNGSVSPVAAGVVDADPVTLTDTQLAAASDDFDFTEVKQAAWEIAAGDRGASFDRFANEWTAHQRTLLEAAYRFRPFQHWDGDATAAVEAAFDAHRSWLYQMADLCGTMARQAQDITSAHRWAVPEHPTLEAVVEQEGYWQQVQAWPPDFREARAYVVRALLDRFATYQAKSEEVLAGYAQRAAIPPVSPPKPPVAVRIAEPPPAPDPGPVPEPAPDWSLDEFPSGLGGGGIPSGGMPTGWDPASLRDALAGAPSLPTGSGLKPASLGGFGGGAPSGPLKPPFFPEASPAPGSAANGAAGLGRGIPGGAMGGGMGMAPMAPPGARGQGNGQGKSSQQDEESLYTEERPWTEAVIGIRQR